MKSELLGGGSHFSVGVLHCSGSPRPYRHRAQPPGQLQISLAWVITGEIACETVPAVTRSVWHTCECLRVNRRESQEHVGNVGTIF